MLLQVSLIVISFIIIVLLAPVLDGIERKIKAKLHSRVGPPTILQSWYDILKLFSKELVLPEGGYLVPILVGLLYTLVLVTLILMPYGFPNPLTLGLPDIILLLVLIIALQLLWSASSLVSGNPYATVGVFREVGLGLVNEFFLALGLIAVALVTGSLGFAGLAHMAPPRLAYALILLSLAIACYVASGRIPYDIGEAEPELASGVLIEFSGPILGLALYAHYLKRAILYGLVANLIVLPLYPILGPVFSVIAFLATMIVLWIVFAIISIVLARSRIDLAPRGLLKIYLPLAIAYSILGYIGV